jgi:hypothetical protein
MTAWSRRATDALLLLVEVHFCQFRIFCWQVEVGRPVAYKKCGQQVSEGLLFFQ